MTRASWSADRVGPAYKVAFYAVGGHPLSLILFDPVDRELGRIPIAGSGMWDMDSCVAQLGANLIGEVTMSPAQFADFSAHWSSYVVRVWGSPAGDAQPGTMIPLVDTGCRATRQ